MSNSGLDVFGKLVRVQDSGDFRSSIPNNVQVRAKELGTEKKIFLDIESFKRVPWKKTEIA